MSKKSVLIYKNFKHLVALIFFAAMPAQSMNRADLFVVASPTTAMVIGAAIAAGPGALLGLSAASVGVLGHFIKIVNDDCNNIRDREALEEIRKKQAELNLHISTGARGQMIDWAHPSQNPHYSDSENLKKNWYARSHDENAIQTIIDRLKSNEFGPRILNLLQECAIISTLPGADPEAFRNLARWTIACYMQGALTPHRLALEDHLPKRGEITLEQYKRWFHEDHSALTQAKQELVEKTNRLAALTAEVNQRRAISPVRRTELETKDARISELSRIVADTRAQKDQAEADLAQERVLRESAIKELEEKRAASPARRAELENKNARIAQLEEQLAASIPAPQPVLQPAQALPVIAILAPERAAVAEQPALQRIQSWLQEKFK